MSINCQSTIGIPGITARFGFFDIGEPKDGDTVVMSTRAGAVGSAVGQPQTQPIEVAMLP